MTEEARHAQYAQVGRWFAEHAACDSPFRSELPFFFVQLLTALPMTSLSVGEEP